MHVPIIYATIPFSVYVQYLCMSSIMYLNMPRELNLLTNQHTVAYYINVMRKQLYKQHYIDIVFW